MESKKFSIGDVVALKVHPYQLDLTDIVVSGDHLFLPPLMVVTEIFKTSHKILGEANPIDTFRYKCIWFSSKSYKFIETDVFETDLHLITTNTISICKSTLRRGDRIILKSAPIELGKKKSSLTYEDNSVNAGNGNTTINSLLSFLPPVLQVVDIIKHKNKNSTTEKKTGGIVRALPSWDVKFFLFDQSSSKISEYTLPLEIMDLLEDIDLEKLQIIQDSINKSVHLAIKNAETKSLVKPRNIANRGGRYYLRAFDYLTNKVEEFEITESMIFKKIKSPFRIEVPTFDITHKPESATPAFITKEIILAVKKGKSNKTYIRIKYKNRNDKISFRTIKEYKITTVKEDKIDVSYLIGFCLYRNAKRNFRIDRIQSLQELKMKF